MLAAAYDKLHVSAEHTSGDRQFRQRAAQDLLPARLEDRRECKLDRVLKHRERGQPLFLALQSAAGGLHGMHLLFEQAAAVRVAAGYAILICLYPFE